MPSIEKIIHRFSLFEDKAEDAVIDNSIRSGVELRGTNLWVLMFAIFIASIGLNVNSTAVIIGAMLISPLMGPIMGIGYGIGIYDIALVKKSLRNLGIATLISLFISTLYFFITPLSDAQSELLARTTPTIWDVLIAFLGGLAGIIGATRSERNNIIPGVAIATALMPPLCTAGYGLANLNAQYFFGAFYLYAINCVFIAFSSVLIVWVLHPQHKQFVDKAIEKKVKNTLTIVVAITIIPSLYLATLMVKNELYMHKARAFISHQFDFPRTSIAAQKIDSAKKKIEVTLVGDVIDAQTLKQIEQQLAKQGLPKSTLLVYQAKDQALDVASLKNNIFNELYEKSLLTIEKRDRDIADLKQQMSTESENAIPIQWQGIAAELSAQYPQIKEAVYSKGQLWNKKEGIADSRMIVINLKANPVLKKEELSRIEAWLKIRTNQPVVHVVAE